MRAPDKEIRSLCTEYLENNIDLYMIQASPNTCETESIYEQVKLSHKIISCKY